MFWRKKGYQSSIDQIEGVVTKLKGFGDVHDLEMGIVQSLYTCMSACVFDHDVTDVDTSHCNLRIFIGNVADPLTRTATEIENSVHSIYIRSLWEQSSHSFGDKTVLVDETGHFCTTLGIDEVIGFFR